jgi:sugar/nucleoside kinase (ribokinase family)
MSAQDPRQFRSLTDDHGRPLDVVVVGNALVDVLSHASKDDVARTGLSVGTMTLVDLEDAARIYAQMGRGTEISGGSGANTAVGVAMLGGRAGYVGKVASDELGDVFVHDIAAAGVEVGRIARAPADEHGSDAVTGRCLVLVSENGERTMATHLGAASTLGPEDLDEELVSRAEVLYLEGYLWDRDPAKAAMKRAIEVAHAADALVALSLSAPFCVTRHQREFLDLLRDDLDVVLANEEEARLLFGSKDLEHMLDSLSETGVLAAVTRGAAGSVVVAGGRPGFVKAEPVERVIDTTGAGDLYAAGFLFGLTRGDDPADCARIGGLCAAEIVSHVGARPETDLKTLVR